MFTEADRARLLRVETLVWKIVYREAKMASTLNDVLTHISDLSSVEDGVVQLLTTLKADLDAALAANDPAQLQAAIDQIDAIKAKAAAAIAANTPAA